ncbi:hypothetical protein HDF22_006025, partial [Mucilaginibacter lappiensis]|nr:hypothetical protein [Mucilaginibacter lappiensis]
HFLSARIALTSSLINRFLSLAFSFVFIRIALTYLPFHPSAFPPSFFPSFRECKGRNLFLFSKTFFSFFILSFEPLFRSSLFPLSGLQRCESYFNLSSDIFTFLNFFYSLDFQKTTPFFLGRPQMYREKRFPSKRNFEIIKTILQLPVN